MAAMIIHLESIKCCRMVIRMLLTVAIIHLAIVQKNEVPRYEFIIAVSDSLFSDGSWNFAMAMYYIMVASLPKTGLDPEPRLQNECYCLAVHSNTLKGSFEFVRNLITKIAVSSSSFFFLLVISFSSCQFRRK